MPYNFETETFYQAPATVVDSTPDGDTVQEGFDDRLTPALAGVYADFNLLKADGMISVGIPATTTAWGIVRVATNDDLVDGAPITNGAAFLAAGVHTSVAAAAGKIPVADANGKIDAWVKQLRRLLPKMPPCRNFVGKGCPRFRNLFQRQHRRRSVNPQRQRDWRKRDLQRAGSGVSDKPSNV